MKIHTRKWLAIVGCMIVCVILTAAITSRFTGELVTDDPPMASTYDQEGPIVDLDRVSPELSTPIANGNQDSYITIQVESPSVDANTAAGNGADSSGTEQSIQANPVKPELPGEEVLTDPDQKPDGTPVENPPIPEDHESYEVPVEVPQSSSTPQGGTVNSAGQTYLPGFGWIENSGENQAVQADDMYENGNKIGIMD